MNSLYYTLSGDEHFTNKYILEFFLHQHKELFFLISPSFPHSFLAAKYFIIWMIYNLFNQFPSDGHLGCS